MSPTRHRTRSWSPDGSTALGNWLPPFDEFVLGDEYLREMSVDREESICVLDCHIGVSTGNGWEDIGHVSIRWSEDLSPLLCCDIDSIVMRSQCLIVVSIVIV